MKLMYLTSTNMQMHELIDRDDPRCLYCNNEVDLKLDGMGVALATYEVQILKCRKCKEQFEIHESGVGNDTKIVAFVFTCKKIAIFYKYDEGFMIGNHDLLWSNRSVNGHPWIIPFTIDFSDKKKLHKKLKTYLVFS